MKTGAKEVAKRVAKKAVKKVAKKVEKPKSQKLTKKDKEEMFAKIELIGAEKIRGAVIVINEDGDGVQIHSKFSSVSYDDILRIITRAMLDNL